ncbi:2-oxo acid dehydrogenase subunit E2 [Pseudomonas sp. CCC3.1]|uniref:2-oxo acid dehydrogenase subunit E2 n=1 Tax=Pseudomonas sp. CCC3.1 TaxID=3048607 RepID=UPI002AC90AF2|nr:2-oxo acid dehydrogenase subunit E2 [Pseudomonas sp. CCC3.1]MEB0206065.1 2-oxo acid dehydrogenase subunit E2 [Pseudomonas sp. CCC3.1]WPX36731.1 2-oxo acid dehydrogenase subunit E2 [Pseudomonas sp. CCC3.1]
MSEIKIIEVPKWGLSMEEGTLNNWLIEEGDSFKQHQELCDIETSKISNVLEAPFDGVLRRKVAQPGQTLPVGGLLGVVADASVSDAEIDAFIAQRGTAPAAAAPQPEVVSVAAAAPAVAVKASEPVAVPAAKTTHGWHVPQALLGASAESVFATPHATRLAKELGIDLSRVNGTGPQGRISVSDIEHAVKDLGGKVATLQPALKADGPARSRADDSHIVATPVARRLAAKLGVNLNDCRVTGSRGRVSKADVLEVSAVQNPRVALTVQATPEAPHADVLPMNGMRKAIAARLQASKRTAPHFRLQADLDLEALLALRSEINASAPAIKLSVNDLLIKACALALIKVPDVNVQFDEERQAVLRFADADISVAVALPAGLITPIVRQANRKSLSSISEEMLSLVTKAKAGNLKPEEFQGGTFSISNLGMLGVSQFDAIINPPQGAILAIGAGEQRVVAHNGQAAVRTQMTVTLSCDHRVIDGALGATFLKELKRLVQTPSLMML